MTLLRRQPNSQGGAATATISIYVDGATGTGEKAGAAAVAQHADGVFVGWLSRHLPPMTNNEAEYRGALLGVELARQIGAKRVEIVSDSTTVVRQMQGRSRVHSPRLRTLHRQLCLAVRSFEEVAFRHVPREENRVADALAVDALHGKEVHTVSRRQGTRLRQSLAALIDRRSTGLRQQE